MGRVITWGVVVLACAGLVAMGVLACLRWCARVDPLEWLAATACAEQRAVVVATLAAYRTQIPPLRTRVADVEATVGMLRATVEAQTPQGGSSPCPSATPLFPTPEATPTMSPALGMCQDCTAGAYVCPSGYTCWDCPQLGKRCVRPSSPNGDCTNCRLAGAGVEFPTLTGLATWYRDSVYVATGELFEPSGLTCAVDVSLWPVLAGETVRVTRLDTGACVDLVVNDCGYLSRAGAFVFETRGGVVRYWPVDVGYSVVVDLSPAAADALTGRETVLVRVEVRRP